MTMFRHFLRRQVNSLNPHLVVRFKSSAATTNPRSSTVSYLINECGLSPESAISASRLVQLEISSKPDSVLSFLKAHGFSDTHITKSVRRHPRILTSDIQKTLLPKFEFLHSIGVSRPAIVEIVSKHPKLVFTSLKRRILPTYEFLKRVLQCDDRVLHVLKGIPRILSVDLSKDVVPNVEHVRKLGAPTNCLCILLKSHCSAVLLKHVEFVAACDEVMKMGFDPRKTGFVVAVRVLGGRSGKLSFERKLKVYESWGWSKDEVLMAFRKYPQCMMLSVEKIQEGMDFFVNEMGLYCPMIANNPHILVYSLEKRIMPRCSVIKTLTMKGLLQKNVCFSSVLIVTENVFLSRYVRKYEDKLPQLLSVYRGKIDPLDT
ncbi:Transcription termination factor, mitochondrial/chloroplastic [Dillenia turbinata]|uniref:Transcription termination factor, mitochondrial/chloroplastic n=1 Tax=Dillenia turbinata TaxID=194707 RepID=A0AAN8WH69_9MAGN